MKRASDIFGDEERKRVDAAVAAAEAKTSAEIVPVVATASGRYDRAEDIVGLAVGLLAMAATWLALPYVPPEPGSWAPHWLGLLELLALIAVVVIGFILGVAIASRSARLRRVLVPRGEMVEDVLTRAHQAFSDSQVHHTAGRTGVMIYVSLLERQAVILADRQALETLGQPVIDILCNALLDRLRKGDPVNALIETITQAGDRLAAALPRAAGDKNEIGDALVTID
jgi:putative membrane protein